MCVDMPRVILHDPYATTYMPLPSWKLESGSSLLGLQGLTVGAFSTPLPMDLTNDALASTFLLLQLNSYELAIMVELFLCLSTFYGIF